MPMTDHIKDILRSKYPVSTQAFKDFLEKEQHDNDVLSNPGFNEADVDRLYSQFMGLPAMNHINAEKNKVSLLSEREQAQKDLADAQTRLEKLDKKSNLAVKAEADAKAIRDEALAEADEIIEKANSKANSLDNKSSNVTVGKKLGKEIKEQADIAKKTHKTTKDSKKGK